MAYLLHQLLTQSASRYPSRDAVVYKEKSITYSELDRVSDNLANVLRANGIERGDRVGIHLNKGLESIVAIFGILKAGAVYVPLDPSAPARRIAFMIANCGMKGLISTGRRAARLASALGDECTLACLVLADGDRGADRGPLKNVRTVPWDEVTAERSPASAPVAGIEDDLGYILYTSGSTGEPKGVMISHRAALTFIDWACDAIGLRTTDRVSSHAPLHFDLSIFDIFATIASGATVILVPEELSVFPIDLANFIEGQRISVWYSVPSVLTRLVLFGGLERHRFSSLRKVLFAGEVFPTKYLRQLKSHVPHAEYYNLYGPTETNVCTFYVVQDLPADDHVPLPIGKACANTQVFAVTDEYEIAMPGEEGELYVRGPGLMKGYWGMPEKTSQMLVRWRVPGTHWEEEVYRTGDLVKPTAEGNYLFLGRRDNMIKSRGYRIELGEIESVLYSHPAVAEAAVIAVPDDLIGHVIKATIVPRASNDLSRAEIESYCADRIPKYMIPAIIEFRSSLPRTSTGKADRTTLLREHVTSSDPATVSGD